MTERDELGVVAFNEAAHWVVKTQPLGGIGDLQGQISGIRADGQTNIYAGLDQAVQSLEGVTATRRHIILLTDGWSNSGQYDAILAKMKAAGITLSTVGAGGGANPFLEQLATKGGGRFYAAANPASIPDIFLKETQQVSGQQIVEEPFFPILTSSSPILRGLDQGLPKLLGYNGTTAKSAAQTVLVTSRDDPLLAQWQYGLGRSVAWTSDSTGRWAKDWLGWKDFARFFSQLVSWTFPGEESGGIEATFDAVGGKTTLHVESVEADGSARDFYATSAVIVGSDPATIEPVNVDLVQVAPGVYEAPLGEIDPGAYAVRITQIRPGTSPLGRTVGLVAPTSAEYRLLGGNEPFLATLRDATGGWRDPHPAGSVAARPEGHQPLHGPVATAADPGAAAVAAGHRPAARFGRPPRGRLSPGLGHQPGWSPRAARSAHRHQREPPCGSGPDRYRGPDGDADGSLGDWNGQPRRGADGHAVHRDRHHLRAVTRRRPTSRIESTRTSGPARQRQPLRPPM